MSDSGRKEYSEAYVARLRRETISTRARLVEIEAQLGEHERAVELQRKPEPEHAEPDFWTIARRSKLDAQRHFLSALGGTPMPEQAEQPEPPPKPTGSFDGGARQSVPVQPVETHEAWLVRTLRSRAADAAASF